jgi:sec-independent protein translocase protein TatA
LALPKISSAMQLSTSVFYYICVLIFKAMLNLLFISGGEIVLVMLLALLFFGAKAIPDIAKTLGKGMREFKKATNEIKREFDDYSSEIKKDIDEVSSTVKKETEQIKKDIDKVSSKVEQESNDIKKDLDKKLND